MLQPYFVHRILKKVINCFKFGNISSFSCTHFDSDQRRIILLVVHVHCLWCWHQGLMDHSQKNDFGSLFGDEQAWGWIFFLAQLSHMKSSPSCFFLSSLAGVLSCQVKPMSTITMYLSSYVCSSVLNLSTSFDWYHWCWILEQLKVKAEE